MGVGVHRVLVESSSVADLDDLAEVHDGDAVGDVPDDRQVVGDEDVGEAELVLQVLEQVDDLRLDRHVEGGDRLVADDELGLERERAGDADALALAAGELVRVAVVVLRVEPDQRRAGPAPASWRRPRLTPCESPSARRRSCRSCGAGSARSTGPGRSSGCRGASSRSCPRDQVRDVLALEPAPCRRSARAAG